MIPDSEAHFVVVEYEVTLRFLTSNGEVTGFILDQAATSQLYTFKKVVPVE